LKLNTAEGAGGVVPAGGWASGTPTGSILYLAVNDETTDKVRTILSGTLDILEASSTDSSRVIIESGLASKPDLPSESVREKMEPDEHSDSFYRITPAARQRWLAKYGLLDYYFTFYPDTRFITRIVGPRACDASFKNYNDGKVEINFVSSFESIPTTLLSSYENHKGVIIEAIDNEMYNFGTHDGRRGASYNYSSLQGPKGTVTAFTLDVDNDLKVNSEGTRNYKYTNYGEIDKMIFDDIHKFDYIDTTIDVVGNSSLARMQLPIRLIRYAGK
jgi:hypothetical protein